MSQIYKQSTGDIPPGVVIQFTTEIADNDPTVTPGIVLPQAGNVNVSARDNSDNNAEGIRTDSDPNNMGDLFIELTNRVRGTANVIGAVTGNIATFNLGAIAAVYRFSFLVTGRDIATGDGVGYTVDASARTDGGAATIISTPDIDADEDASLVGAQINVIASGNNVILQATGVAGQTISYNALGNYIMV